MIYWKFCWRWLSDFNPYIQVNNRSYKDACANSLDNLFGSLSYFVRIIVRKDSRSMECEWHLVFHNKIGGKWAVTAMKLEIYMCRQPYGKNSVSNKILSQTWTFWRIRMKEGHPFICSLPFGWIFMLNSYTWYWQCLY